MVGNSDDERSRKECEERDDGRYIIFYTFEYEKAGESELHPEEGAN